MPNGTSLNQSNITLVEYQSSKVFSTVCYHITVSYGRYDTAEIIFRQAGIALKNFRFFMFHPY